MNYMECPYCSRELCEWNRQFYCGNLLCSAKGVELPKFLWQDLIDGKKAQDALKKARELYKSLAISYCAMGDDFRTSYGRLKTFEQEAEEYMQDYDKEIAAIAKQDVKE